MVGVRLKVMPPVLIHKWSPAAIVSLVTRSLNLLVSEENRWRESCVGKRCSGTFSARWRSGECERS